MAPGESFESSSPSSGENFSPWFEDSLDDTEPYEKLSGEEIVEQIIAERHRPADPKKVYPEIYGEDYNRDISPKCKTTLESLDKADYFDLIDAYETNYKFGNARLVGYLAKMLGLESLPKITYKPKGEKDTQTCAYYDPDDNSIVFSMSQGVVKRAIIKMLTPRRTKCGTLTKSNARATVVVTVTTFMMLTLGIM